MTPYNQEISDTLTCGYIAIRCDIEALRGELLTLEEERMGDLPGRQLLTDIGRV